MRSELAALRGSRQMTGSEVKVSKLEKKGCFVLMRVQILSV